MHPLDGVWLKLDRAKEHLDFLYAAITNFWNLNPIAIIPEEDPQAAYYRFRFKVNREPDARWSVVVGDIAFNMRSALDHLAWQLALLHVVGRDPSSSTEFPIFNSALDYNNPRSGASRKLRDVLPAAHTVIESLQPYHRIQWPLVEHLWWLHEVNITDKHRTIIPCFPTSMLRFGNTPGILRHPGPLNDGYVIRVPKTVSNMKMEVGTDISFEYPRLAFGINFDKIDGIHKFIREELMPLFKPFFP